MSFVAHVHAGADADHDPLHSELIARLLAGLRHVPSWDQDAMLRPNEPNAMVLVELSLFELRRWLRVAAASHLKRRWKLKCGGEDGVDAVAVTALEIVAVQAVVGLDVADDRLDRGASFHLAFDRGGGSPDLAGDEDAEPVRVIVTAIALVDMDAPHINAGISLDVGDSGLQRMAVEGIAVKRLGVQDNLTPLGLVTGWRSRPCSRTRKAPCAERSHPPLHRGVAGVAMAVLNFKHEMPRNADAPGQFGARQAGTKPGVLQPRATKSGDHALRCVNANSSSRASPKYVLTPRCDSWYACNMPTSRPGKQPRRRRVFISASLRSRSGARNVA